METKCVGDLVIRLVGWGWDMCGLCNGSGHVFTCSKENFCTYTFICSCYSGQKWVNFGYKQIPLWDKKKEQHFVAEYQDKIPLNKDWVIQMCIDKKTDDPLFKSRLSIWGRSLFEDIWTRHKAKEKKQ